jgi:hypothetical protein
VRGKIEKICWVGGGENDKGVENNSTGQKCNMQGVTSTNARPKQALAKADCCKVFSNGFLL